MQEIIQNIDWMQVLAVIWTVIIVPILTYAKKEFDEWVKSKDLDKYSTMLIDAVDSSVKDTYETIVKEIKKTDEWTDERKQEVLEHAKTKIKVALTTEGYSFLDTAHEDLELWITTLIEAKLYDLKHQK